MQIFKQINVKQVSAVAVTLDSTGYEYSIESTATRNTFDVFVECSEEQETEVRDLIRRAANLQFLPLSDIARRAKCCALGLRRPEVPGTQCPECFSIK
jgi:hypothetical protein